MFVLFQSVYCLLINNYLLIMYCYPVYHDMHVTCHMSNVGPMGAGGGCIQAHMCQIYVIYSYI